MSKATQRFHDKREAILAAAALEFNQHGIKGATLAGVAGRVGLLKASLNYYYRRKEDLAADGMLQAVAAMHGVAVAAQAQADPRDRVRALLAGKAALLADIAEGRRGALVSFNEIRALSPPHGERVPGAAAGRHDGRATTTRVAGRAPCRPRSRPSRRRSRRRRRRRT